MSTVEQTPDAAPARDAWLAALDRLLDQVRQWSLEQGWRVYAEEKEIREKLLGEYRTRILQIETPEGTLIVEPIAASVHSALGRVDLYAWATRNTVRLLRRQEDWVIRTESGIDWPFGWGRETFVDVSRRLLAAQ